MLIKNIKKITAQLPDTPGVYIFRDKAKKILYIGKATSLRDRVRSYFNKDIVNTRSPLIWKMLEEFTKIEHIKTDSVLEALVLEASLIKKYQPEANIKEKDNRSFNFVVITHEDFPRVLVVRSRNLLSYEKSKWSSLAIYRKRSSSHSQSEISDSNIAYSFGPFPNGSQLKEAIKIIRKMFPYRDKCFPCEENLKKLKKPKETSFNNKRLIYDISYISNNREGQNKYCKPCFNRQIGLCPGVCTGEISKDEYREQIKNIVLFFEGNKKKLIKNLENQMKTFAKVKEFEKANKIKRTIFTLNHIQDISLIKEDVLNKNIDGSTFRIESYDIAHMSGQNVVGVMTVVEDGELKLSDYRKFKIRDIEKGQSGINDTKALSEVLSRRLAHIEWKFPDLIVVDGGVAQRNAINKVLKANSQDIPVVSVVKDEHHKPKEILGDKKWLKYEREIILANSESHRYGIAYHKKLREKLQ